VLTLRDYQSTVGEAIQAAWDRIRAVLFVLATGGGKTVVFCYLILRHNGAAAAIVHRREIVSQICCSLAELGIKHRVIAPPKTITLIRRKQLKRFGESFVDPNARVGVVSVQTLTSRGTKNNEATQRWIRQVTLAVFDEGHHYTQSGFWSRAVEMFGHAKLLFATATPERADGKGLAAHADGYAQELVEGPQTWELIRDGYLSSFTYLAPASDLDVSNIPLTKAGDFNAREFRKRVVDSHLVGDVVKHYKQYGNGGRAIVFATDIETADEMALSFNAAGINAISLNGESHQADRDSGLERFESGDVRILVNVDLFDEGFDVPSAEVCIMARPTYSTAKFLQMIGRVLRPMYAAGYDLSTVAARRHAIAAGPKPFAIVIDMVRNWERGHGLPDWPRTWSLEGRERGTRGGRDTQPMQVCISCTQPFDMFLRICPYCGTLVPLPDRRTVTTVAGDLFELDTQAMAALFRAQQEAELDDEAFRVDMHRRHVPTYGQPRQLRAHQAGRYRRAVLRELVAWWVGMQPAGRDLPEKHRRFYYRFGIDIGTAFTLNATDTDALIDRMAARFTEDM
jgi:DNA repair protein RadD